MLQEFFRLHLKDMDLDKLWFQQHSATCHLIAKNYVFPQIKSGAQSEIPYIGGILMPTATN